MTAGIHRAAMARRRAACALVFTLAAFVPVAAHATAVAPTYSAPAGSSTVVVLAPYLTWSDISAEKTPAIWSLMGDAALGNMNAHTAEYGTPTLAGGVLTLSASRWATGLTVGPLDAASLDRARAANDGSLSKPTLGSLGDALHAAGRYTIAVGASDTETATDAGRLRPAELLATDASGTVALRLADVLVPDAAAAFGLHTDPGRLNRALGQALVAQPAGRLIVIDIGDLSRAHDATAPADVMARRHDAAVQLLDSTVGTLTRRFGRPSRGNQFVLMIVPAVTDKQWYKAPDLGPLIISGAGFRGRIVSASTRRPGLTTNLDIAPTVLASLGATVPADMLGKPLAFEAYPDAAQLVSRLARDGAAPGIIDQLRDAWFLRWFCYAAIGAVALAGLVAFVPVGWLSVIAELALIVVLSALPAGWLMFLVDSQPVTISAAARALLIATAAVASVAVTIRFVFSASRIAAPLFLTSLTSLVVLADQWSGRAIESGVFSYSVAAGWRYYGMGNEGAAILVGASIATVALAADALAGRPAWAGAIRRAGMPLVGLVVLVTAAAPFAGANAGVAVWGVVAFGAAWAAVNGVRLSWRTVGLTVVAVVVSVAALAAVDLLQSSGGESHLARFARGVLRGDTGATGQLIRRKLANNLAYLPQTTYTGLAVAMSAVLGLLGLAPSRPLARGLRQAPTYAKALLGIVIGSLLAWATEDSGVVMPALMLLVGATPALLLVLRTAGDGRPGVRDE